MSQSKPPLASAIVAGAPDITAPQVDHPLTDSPQSASGTTEVSSIINLGDTVGGILGNKIGGPAGEAIGSTVGKVVVGALAGGILAGSALASEVDAVLDDKNIDPTSEGLAEPLATSTSTTHSSDFTDPLAQEPQEYYPVKNPPNSSDFEDMSDVASLLSSGLQRPPNANSVWFTITMQGGHFGVYSFKGYEETHKSYEFIVELVSNSASVDIATLPGTQACLTIYDRSNEKRLVHGLIREMKQLHTANQFTHYRVVIVPRLYFLGQITDCRIFQNMTVVEIIQKILHEQGFTGEQSSFKVGQKLQSREYCVQYNESYLHFITRLCEEEGIFFYFTHKENNHCVCFYDYAGGDPIPGTNTLRYFQGSGQPADYAVINKLELSHKVNSNAAMYKEWNFTIPKVDLTVQERESDTKKAPLPPGMLLEQYQYPHIYDEKDTGTRYVKLEVDRTLAFAKWIDCQSDVSRFLPAHTFTVIQHPRQDVNASWWVFAVEHEGEQPSVLQHESPSDRGLHYRAFVQAIPADTRFVPKWEHPKHRIIGTQTAIVIGPESEEIYPDKYGRVKVQFFWDREGKWDENTTCWIRASQGWAGSNFGTMAIPRIGHEVIVSFLEGDPDRPLITGRVYHDVNMPPYELPKNKTRTVFKSMSTPGENGEERGFNELRIEDKKDEEEIYAHAEKDVNVYVKNDWKEHILHDKHETVDQFRYTHIKEEEHLLIEKVRRQELKEKDYLTVHNDSHTDYKTKWLAQAGEEIHLKAGTKVVMEAGADLTIKAGGSFIRLNSAGVTIVGSLVKVNSGGAANNGTGVSMEEPEQALLIGESPKPKKETVEGKDGEGKEAIAGRTIVPFDERHLCRQELVDMAKASDDPEIQALGTQLQQELIAEQHAALAQHVYTPDSPVPEGWARMTNDAEELKKYGLEPTLFRMGSSNFKAEMYVPDPGVLGNSMPATIAFKGTDFFSKEDWQNNYLQALGKKSQYYTQAKQIAIRAQNSSEPIQFSGHSLGGGLASAAAVSAKAPATTFNAAGIHENTLQNLPHSSLANIQAYCLDGEILTYAQKSSSLPEAIGRQTVLSALPRTSMEYIYTFGEMEGGADLANSIEEIRHSVAKHSITPTTEAMTKQRAQTQNHLEEALGKQCP